MVRRALIQANAQLSEEEQKLLCVEVIYGKDLADRVRASLGRRNI